MNNASAEVAPLADSPTTSDSESVVWQVEITPRGGMVDRIGERILSELRDAHAPSELRISGARGFLIQTGRPLSEVTRAAEAILVDSIVEQYRILDAADPSSSAVRGSHDPARSLLPLHVLLKPGVTDPEADSARDALEEFGLAVDAVRTFRKYWIQSNASDPWLAAIKKLLANDAIEQVIVGPLGLKNIDIGSDYEFELTIVPIRSASPEQLRQINERGQLSLSDEEMATIQRHFCDLNRDPTDVELETIAQTWSEHCSHKTLAGAIVYRDENGERTFGNMLKETIFAATQTIREQLADKDWCVSVFRDNAGVVRFDDELNVAFKVETHNRPSALEPYGGANTGIGGVIRDILGTGMGAKPICSTDVFCFAPPNLEPADLPANVLHPRRIMKGVVAGVRDYGNRMGIPTVNGAICFDPRYVGNPLVFCGSVGVLPADKSFKRPQPNDLIVALGGRTGRDGIHGATFSSAELHEHSETTSGGAVQIGNAITEKMFLDVLMQARDENLFSSVTDCGAGGFSSAVGEMGEEIGAEVWLEKVPLKYRGLSYTEIWISEAQERMVLAVPAKQWPRLKALCESEGVEATVIGEFKPTGRLKLLYDSQQVADLSMEFLHGGRPKVHRQATFAAPATRQINPSDLAAIDPAAALLKILGSFNVASKHWVIRQYDHEVQGCSVIKPLVGRMSDGPSDAAVLRPRFDSWRGLVVACGLNPRYGDFDPYHMAQSAIDEAIRNCVAVGADPARIAILDNFCWGRTDRPQTLGSLVRAALGCHDLAVALQTPFISGKDSLHNEFKFTDASGRPQTIAIPGTLLISALGQIDDVRRCVTMDFKQAGNAIYLIGQTGDHLGGSHLAIVENLAGGIVPTVNARNARDTFQKLHRAIDRSLVRSCHDLSEGGLAVALAEMAFAGICGAEVDISGIAADKPTGNSRELDILRLFSESNSRFLVEVEPRNEAAFAAALDGVSICRLGTVTIGEDVIVRNGPREILRQSICDLKQAWQSPLDWS